MSFETFDVRGNNPTPTSGRAFEAAHPRQPHSQGQPGAAGSYLLAILAWARLIWPSPSPGVQIERGNAVVFAFVPDLMDYLRARSVPESPVRYDRLFEEVKTAPLLILDDFGKERRSDWAVEKLYQIIVHRHNLRLPTVITSDRETQ